MQRLLPIWMVVRPYRAQAGALKAKVRDEVLSNVGKNEQQTAVEGGYEKFRVGPLQSGDCFLSQRPSSKMILSKS